MKLNKLKLKNFRSYSQETEINISNLNVIIGKNDVRKSSVLEALDIFFNGKPDKYDLCIENDNSRIEITCIFSDLPDQLILDDTIVTSLSDEYLLNSACGAVKQIIEVTEVETTIFKQLDIDVID